jgi:hypothetical protein
LLVSLRATSKVSPDRAAEEVTRAGGGEIRSGTTGGGATNEFRLVGGGEGCEGMHGSLLSSLVFTKCRMS